MHEGGCGTDIRGEILVEGRHLDVWVVLGKVFRVCVVLCVLGDGGGRGVEVVVAEDPYETPVAGGTDDTAGGVADHGCGVEGPVGRGGGGKEHALGVVVAVEAMEKREEDGVGGVCGEMGEMHAGKEGGGKEGKRARMAQRAAVWRDDAVGGGHRRRVRDRK